jgi:hypothetical protein
MLLWGWCPFKTKNKTVGPPVLLYGSYWLGFSNLKIVQPVLVNRCGQRMTEQENQDRTGRNRTLTTGHPGQQPRDVPNIAAKMGQQKQNRTVRTRQPEEDCQDRIVNTGRQG